MHGTYLRQYVCTVDLVSYCSSCSISGLQFFFPRRKTQRSKSYRDYVRVGTADGRCYRRSPGTDDRGPKFPSNDRFARSSWARCDQEFLTPVSSCLFHVMFSNRVLRYQKIHTKKVTDTVPGYPLIYIAIVPTFHSRFFFRLTQYMYICIYIILYMHCCYYGYTRGGRPGGLPSVQASRFGAVLDMVTDRCSTAGLLMVLARLYGGTPAFLFLVLMFTDLFSHWMHVQRWHYDSFGTWLFVFNASESLIIFF